MKRVMKTAIAAQVGATAGYLVHQAREHCGSSDEERGEVQIVAGAPWLNLVIGFLVGLVTRKRLLAFATGFALSAVFGTTLGDQVRAAAEERAGRDAQAGTEITGSIET